MKKLITISAIVLSGLVYNAANAQIRIGIRLPHITIVSRPVVVRTGPPVYQQPVVSDDCDFYYLPDVGAYYSVTEQCYYYKDGDSWVAAAYLPGVYHDFDWRYAARRFEIRESRPYLRNDFYRGRYQGFDRNIARYHNDFRGGFDYRHNNYAYNNDHRFDNRGNFGQHFDNNHDKGNHFDNHGQGAYGHNNGRDNRDNNYGQQNNQGHNRGDHNNQQANRDNGRGNSNNRQNDHSQNKGDRDNQRLAQNNNGFGARNHTKEHF